MIENVKPTLNWLQSSVWDGTLERSWEGDGGEGFELNSKKIYKGKLCEKKRHAQRVAQKKTF